jgi:hypothetical protein
MSTKITVADLGTKNKAVLPALFDFYELLRGYVYLQAYLLQANARFSRA